MPGAADARDKRCIHEMLTFDALRESLLSFSFSLSIASLAYLPTCAASMSPRVF